MLERDGDYPSAAELAGELAAIRAAVGRSGTTTPGLAPLPDPIQVSPAAEPTRTRLAEAQTRLAGALAGTAGLPAEFDDERPRTQRVALVRKRSNAVAWHAPGVATMLGDRLTALFTDYAAAVPKPEGGSGNDVAAFVAYLRSTSVLTGSKRRPGCACPVSSGTGPGGRRYRAGA